MLSSVNLPGGVQVRRLASNVADQSVPGRTRADPRPSVSLTEEEARVGRAADATVSAELGIGPRLVFGRALTVPLCRSRFFEEGDVSRPGLTFARLTSLTCTRSFPWLCSCW